MKNILKAWNKYNEAKFKDEEETEVRWKFLGQWKSLQNQEEEVNQEFAEDEVRDTLMKTKTRKATCADGITEVLKFVR